MPKTFTNLPDELWARIFYFLGPYDHSKIREVSKRAQRVIDDHAFLRSILHKYPQLVRHISALELALQTSHANDWRYWAGLIRKAHQKEYGDLPSKLQVAVYDIFDGVLSAELSADELLTLSSGTQTSLFLVARDKKTRKSIYQILVNNANYLPSEYWAIALQQDDKLNTKEFIEKIDQPLTDPDEGTPLFVAAELGQSGSVKILLAAKANVHLSRTSDGATPLFVAAENGHSEVVKILLAAGAKVETPRKSGVPPIYIAAQNGHSEVVRILLAAGADAEPPSNHRMTSLLIAAQNGHSEVVRILLAAGANVHRPSSLTGSIGATPLFVAAANGHAEVVRVLLAAGANIEARTRDGATPLSIATENGHHDIVAILGGTANPNLADNDGRVSTPIAAENNDETLEYILNAATNAPAPKLRRSDTPNAQ